MLATAADKEFFNFRPVQITAARAEILQHCTGVVAVEGEHPLVKWHAKALFAAVEDFCR